MVQSKTPTPFTQTELDCYLDKPREISILSNPASPIPSTISHYHPLRVVLGKNLNFTYRELLHAVGCKQTALPSSEKDECIRSAHFLVHQLDITQNGVHAVKMIDSDFVTPRSHALGVGFVCILAARLWGFDWDQLQPIPGPGKRFDYRAVKDGLSARFEARGTSSFAKQESQIQVGLQKKGTEKGKGMHPDVHLVVSTAVQTYPKPSRIMVADPIEEVGNWAFSQGAHKYFRLRHFSRVAKFAGLPRIAVWLNSLAKSRLWIEATSPSILFQILDESRHWYFPEESKVTIEGRNVIGQWYRTWYPKGSGRYEYKQDRENRLVSGWPPIEVFQGIDGEVLDKLISGKVESASIPSGLDTTTMTMDDGVKVIMFPDGSISGFRIYNQK